MATRVQNLDEALDNAALELAEWDAQKVTYSDQGRSQDWNGRYSILLDALERLQKAKQLAGGPCMARSYGRAV